MKNFEQKYLCQNVFLGFQSFFGFDIAFIITLPDISIPRNHQVFHFSNYQISDEWQNKRPVWLFIFLNKISTHLYDKSTSPLLDWYLAQRAIDTKKKIFYVESSYEQCNPLPSVSDEEVMYSHKFLV